MKRLVVVAAIAAGCITDEGSVSAQIDALPGIQPVDLVSWPECPPYVAPSPCEECMIIEHRDDDGSLFALVVHPPDEAFNKWEFFPGTDRLMFQQVVGGLIFGCWPSGRMAWEMTPVAAPMRHGSDWECWTADGAEWDCGDKPGDWTEMHTKIVREHRASVIIVQDFPDAGSR